MAISSPVRIKVMTDRRAWGADHRIMVVLAKCGATFVLIASNATTTKTNENTAIEAQRKRGPEAGELAK